MEQEKIRELLDKYFGGETSEDEERILREYLGSASAPDSMTREFGYLAMKPEQVPEPSEVSTCNLPPCPLVMIS